MAVPDVRYRRPEVHRAALAAFVGAGMDADGGLRLPASGAQRVRWTRAVQERAGMPGERVYTVAADTDRSGLLYLAVAVRRTRSGALALGGYPALVGQPTVTAAGPPADGEWREVGDRELTGVVRRALDNYLAGSAVNLAADLSARAHVALPGLALVLERVSALVWSPGGGAVLATVRAGDRWGTGYTLRYELDVSRATGRWEIGAIHMDPTT